MTTFVLVHGSWHGAWCWKNSTPLLRRAGEDAYAPTLSGCGSNSHTLHAGIDLAMHIADVTNLLFFEDLHDVVLVGHSYGGMVTYGASIASAARIAGIIYLDGYLPLPGQTGFLLWAQDRVAQARAAMAHGDCFRDPATPSALGITDPAQAAWTAERLTPHPLRTYDQPVPAETAESARIPRAYILSTAAATTPMFAPIAQRLRSQGVPIHEIAAGHNAMMTHPEIIAAILREFAAMLA